MCLQWRVSTKEVNMKTLIRIANAPITMWVLAILGLIIVGLDVKVWRP
jgi:hypothetical protein